MMLLDIILLAIVVGFGIYGFASGFVHTVTSLIGTIFSIIVAINTYTTVAFWILPDMLASQFWMQTIVFFVILAIASNAVQILVKVIGKAFDVVSIIPFTKTINRLLGVLIGLIEGVLIAATLIYVLTSLPNLPEAVQEAVDGSRITGVLMFLSLAMTWAFPSAVERAQDLIGETMTGT